MNEEQKAGAMAEGQIPQSQLLAEASEDSISELLSRDPFGFSKQDRAQIILIYRAQRARFEAAQAAGVKVPKQPKAQALKTSSSELDMADLGL